MLLSARLPDNGENCFWQPELAQLIISPGRSGRSVEHVLRGGMHDASFFTLCPPPSSSSSRAIDVDVEKLSGAKLLLHVGRRERNLKYHVQFVFLLSLNSKINSCTHPLVPAKSPTRKERKESGRY